MVIKRLLLLLIPLVSLASAVVADEQSIINRINEQRELQAEQKKRQEEVDNERWREFKYCRDPKYFLCSWQYYDWKGWVKDGFVYTTKRKPSLDRSWGDGEKISVNCRTFQVRLPGYIIHTGDYGEDPVVRKRLEALDREVQKWRLPEEGLETQMVAALCSGR